MADPKVEFHLCTEGDDGEIIKAIRSFEKDGTDKDGHYEPGPLLDEYLGSRTRTFDDDPDSNMMGSIGLPNAGTLASLILALKDAKHLDHWYLTVSVQTDDGLCVYAQLTRGQYSRPGEATAEVRADREKMLGAMVGAVKKAKGILGAALEGKNPEVYS